MGENLGTDVRVIVDCKGKARGHTGSNTMTPRVFASSVDIALSGMEMGPVALAGSICSWRVAISFT